MHKQEEILVIFMVRIIIISLLCMIPLFIYYSLYNRSLKQAKFSGATKPSFFNIKLLKAFIYSLAIAIVAFLIMITFLINDDDKGDYTPATVIKGKIVKGYVAE